MAFGTYDKETEGAVGYLGFHDVLCHRCSGVHRPGQAPTSPLSHPVCFEEQSKLQAPADVSSEPVDPRHRDGVSP